MAIGAALLVNAGLGDPAPAHAGRATCNNPGLPAGASGSGDLLPGRLTLGVGFALLPLSSSEILDAQGGAIQYDSSFVVAETRLSAGYALTPWLSLESSLPFRVIDVGVTYRDPASGQIVVPADAGIHARDETLRGLGDPSLGVHVADERAGLRLHARAGVTLPLGGTEENPFVLGMIGQEHQHLQLGTGTFIPSLALEVQRAAGPVTISGWALTYQSLYDNGLGYRAGDRYSAGVNASSSLGRRAWSFNLAAEVHAETAETWDGITYPDEGNAGRTDVMLGGGAAWRPLSSLAVVVDLKLPVYAHVVGPQLDYGPVLGLSVVVTRDLKRRPSWRGLDRAELGARGSAAPLTPAPDRVTVIDLWADWCAPCRELDQRLEALARRFPDRLAVRTLDVVDTDSEAWARYLEPGGFALPHVKVFGPDGVLLFERSAPPAELVRAIEAILVRRADR